MKVLFLTLNKELEGGDINVGQSSEKMLKQILLKSRVCHVHVSLQDGARAKADPQSAQTPPKHRSESCFLLTQTTSSGNSH